MALEWKKLKFTSKSTPTVLMSTLCLLALKMGPHIYTGPDLGHHCDCRYSGTWWYQGISRHSADNKVINVFFLVFWISVIMLNILFTLSHHSFENSPWNFMKHFWVLMTWQFHAVLSVAILITSDFDKLDRIAIYHLQYYYIQCLGIIGKVASGSHGSNWHIDGTCGQSCPWIRASAGTVLTLIHYGNVKMGTIASQITSLRLFTQSFIRTQIKENIKAPRHWPLCGEFTGDRWIPRTNGQ